jgi:ribosomal protein S18 acetylase RimI-like enzyme
MHAIDHARPDEWLAAFELTYQHSPPSVRHLQVAEAMRLLQTGFFDPRGIWIERRGGGVCGVQICVPLGGGSFLFWLPETRRSNTDALVVAALAWCREQHGKLAQAIVAPADAVRVTPLVRHGFLRVTQLQYLEHALRDVPHQPVETLCCERYSAGNATLFRETLARSYTGTLDCPELNGVRTVDDVLEGYEAARAGRRAPWWLLRVGEDAVGVVILTELPDGPWDLSYVGIVPEHRRKGLARAATRRALAAARDARASQMLLAVDVRNTPARQLYLSVGFVPSDERDVYLHFLDNESAPGP